jgi:hypothetical protein
MKNEFDSVYDKENGKKKKNRKKGDDEVCVCVLYVVWCAVCSVCMRV